MRSLLIAVGMLMAGSGLLAPLLGLEAAAAGFSTIVTGLMLASYYGGFLIGSLVVPGQIDRIGHIRVFAALGSLASGAALVHALVAEPISWMAARLVMGTCMAGLFVVTESWLNGLVTPESRGRAMARYMFVLFAGLAVGNLLLTIGARPTQLIILASVAVSVAVVPVSLTRTTPPWQEDANPVSIGRLARFVPLAVACSTTSGFISGSVLGFTAVYGVQVGLGVTRISLLLTVLVVAAAVVQPPLGALSDRLERRRVIAAVSLASGAAAVGAALLGADPAYAALVALTAVAGSLGIALYGLGVAHAGDYLDPGQMTGAGAKLMLVNGAGAMAGPLVASVLTELLGPTAFWWLLAGAALPLGSYALYRAAVRARAAAQVSYVPLAPTLVTPVAAEETVHEYAEEPALADSR